jgi:hypothetical protein
VSDNIHASHCHGPTGLSADIVKAEVFARNVTAPRELDRLAPPRPTPRPLTAHKTSARRRWVTRRSIAMKCNSAARGQIRAQTLQRRAAPSLPAVWRAGA